MKQATAQAIQRMNEGLREAGKRYTSKLEKTERNFLESYQGFEQFKSKMTEKNNLDLTDLDVKLQDGKLKLESEILSDKQLRELENHLAEDKELSGLLTTTLTDITLLARHSPGQNEHPAFDIDENYAVKDGDLSLNKLVGAYNEEFERFHKDSLVVKDRTLLGDAAYEPLLDRYQSFEERYQRDGLGQFVWLALADATGYSTPDSIINTQA